ncbi:MAG TPA: hypothetical protein VGH87_03435 [Polyangiaceae bacterium]
MPTPGVDANRRFGPLGALFRTPSAALATNRSISDRDEFVGSARKSSPIVTSAQLARVGVEGVAPVQPSNNKAPAQTKVLDETKLGGFEERTQAGAGAVQS